MALELQQAGWPRARALVGGWQAWRDAGLPLARREQSAEVHPPVI